MAQRRGKQLTIGSSDPWRSSPWNIVLPSAERIPERMLSLSDDSESRLCKQEFDTSEGWFSVAVPPNSTTYLDVFYGSLQSDLDGLRLARPLVFPSVRDARDHSGIGAASTWPGNRQIAFRTHILSLSKIAHSQKTKKVVMGQINIHSQSQKG